MLVLHKFIFFSLKNLPVCLMALMRLLYSSRCSKQLCFGRIVLSLPILNSGSAYSTTISRFSEDIFDSRNGSIEACYSYRWLLYFINGWPTLPIIYIDPPDNLLSILKLLWLPEFMTCVILSGDICEYPLSFRNNCCFNWSSISRFSYVVDFKSSVIYVLNSEYLPNLVLSSVAIADTYSYINFSYILFLLLFHVILLNSYCSCI